MGSRDGMGLVRVVGDGTREGWVVGSGRYGLLMGWKVGRERVDAG